MRSVTQEIIDLVNQDIVFSDIHIQEELPVMIKGPTGWVEYHEMFPLSRQDLVPLLESLDFEWEESLKKGSINRPIDLSNWRLRINAYLTEGGNRIGMSVRKIPRVPMPLSDLGLPPSVAMMLDSPRGIILVGGATGTGKTTTIAAMAERINQTRAAHIVTVEDPIEFVLERNKAIFSQREVGVDVNTFFEGVRDAMRQRPDVVIIGEIRDRETAETALIASESGHLVIASLHANTVIGSIQKMLGFFSANEREAKVAVLQSTLVGAIGQILLPSKDGKKVVLASELLLNNNQQFSKFLGDKDGLYSAFSRANDGVSRTFVASLLELVRTDRVAEKDALMAAGQYQRELYDQIKALRAR